MLHIPQMLLKQESQADKQLTQVCLLQLEHFLGTSSDKVLTHEVHERAGRQARSHWSLKFLRRIRDFFACNPEFAQ